MARVGAVAGGDVRSISLGDYLSMSDDLRFDDLQAALDRAWDDHGSAQRGSDLALCLVDA
ncbi:hypothetical protein TVNIR_0757 [Thioalkalivibrio nitratireducens DSM 14787]|uniref:Uncharacterized protein n=1 Tax=Thioalkalivibrio nitratireducens (strain DSM 14787 / UNIQEM 213 / ALEN2) TaxID=1255043 RepID=L0DTZ2_THIND|nr:hypothetical protein TVNIR_0757 [Thioalkalivibrio nitratireducens DSM 14787]